MPAWIAATSAADSSFVRSSPDTSAAKQGPIWRMVAGMATTSFSRLSPILDRAVPGVTASAYPVGAIRPAIVEQQRRDPRCDPAGALDDLAWTEAADRMRQHRVRIAGHAGEARHRLRSRHEWLGDDDR